METPDPATIKNATKDLVESLKRMEDRTRMQFKNKVLEVARIHGLLNRETTTSKRRTKLLRKLGTAEREMKSVEGYLNGILGQLRATAEETSDAHAG